MSTVKEKMLFSSALERRFLCPGSAAVEAKYPYSTERSPAAQEGEWLHEATYNALKGLPMQPEKAPKLTEEQEQCVNYCIEQMKPYTDDKSYTMITEYQLDLEAQKRLNKPRIDVGFILAGERIVIFELKFGSGFVKHPRWNWQTKDYAQGAWLTFGGKEVEVVILQPRAPDEQDWRRGTTFDADELGKIGDEVMDIVNRACEPDAALVPGTEQCQWCRAKQECVARKRVIDTIPQHLTTSAALDAMQPIDRYHLVEKVLAAQAWLKDYKLAIDEYMLDGGEIPGWELGEARTRPKWRDDIETMTTLREAALKKGLDPEKLILPEKPVGITEARKILGQAKSMKDIFDKLTVMPVGVTKPVRVKGFQP